MTASGADATVYVRLVERMQRYMFTYGYEYIYGVYLTQKQTYTVLWHLLQPCRLLVCVEIQPNFGNSVRLSLILPHLPFF